MSLLQRVCHPFSRYRLLSAYSLRSSDHSITVTSHVPTALWYSKLRTMRVVSQSCNIVKDTHGLVHANDQQQLEPSLLSFSQHVLQAILFRTFRSGSVTFPRCMFFRFPYRSAKFLIYSPQFNRHDVLSIPLRPERTSRATFDTIAATLARRLSPDRSLRFQKGRIE